MNPVLLRRILMWLSPIVIGYLMKKYEERQNKKKALKNLIEK
ncbi:hypothetical protein [Frigoriflavimonas asaccharolytica]|uniref:Uncharacterized membrane protein YbhN (UPF0104 family) n=1 Tax=Frigoriflavimonas asaccharolytica TaxID=2735899 RepID=A0A8J8GBE8_9FLAO|nr:hypothetical protein [Frigoriflavimonas asaccharolytica]NRS92587.1 uncharacterized membrane protein YbhN (UPF0104 family) [Frigoriflavimonas asaccharolytica]